MSIQNQLDNQAINMIPKLSNLIKSAPDFESNQMRGFSIRTINALDTPLAEMCQEELESVFESLLEAFRNKEWI